MRRQQPLSMWAWLGQRVSGLFALGLVSYHLYDPIDPRVQTLLIGFVGVHAMLGLRVIVMDLLGSRGRGRVAPPAAR